MHLDMTMTMGNVLTIAGYVLAIVIAYYGIRERLVRIETQLKPIVRWWDNRAERRAAKENGA